MKVKNETKYSAAGICDFCGSREAKHSLNGSLWFLCTLCMKKAMMSTYENLNGFGEEE